MKQTLANILRIRTTTIEYRAIRKQCMNVAQNRGTQVLLMHIEPHTLTMLQNEMLTVELIEDHGYKKYKISW